MEMVRGGGAFAQGEELCKRDLAKASRREWASLGRIGRSVGRSAGRSVKIVILLNVWWLSNCFLIDFLKRFGYQNGYKIRAQSEQKTLTNE